jgi:hypothetical protein
MKTIEILISNKIAIAPADALLVCGNSDYQINFTFDEEWAKYNKKTARFIFGNKYIDAEFEGNTCKGVVIANTREVYIGVYADNGELATTTSARIECKKSVQCSSVAGEYTGEVLRLKGDKGDSAYDIAVLNGYEGTEQEWLESLNPVNPETVKEVVNEYLEKNPIDITVTSVNGQKGDVEITADSIGAISENELQGAINEALQQAKDSGEFDGKDGDKGDKGDAFTYDDFTTSQLEALKGAKGDPFTYADFTASQLEALKGEKGDAFKYEDFTPEQLETLKGEDGDSAYELAQKNGFIGTEAEWLESLGAADLESIENAVDNYFKDNPINIEPPNLSEYLKSEVAKETYQPKGDYLTEHQKLKTINGQSLLGEGNLTIEGGSSGGTSVQAEFVNVKYLENTGTQYIDTGYVLQEDDVLEVDYEIPEEALSIKTDKILIDARDSTNGVRVSTYSGTYKWYARFGYNASQTSAPLTSSSKGSLTLKKGQFILNGAVIFDDLVFSAMPIGTLKLLAGVNYNTGAISAPSYARISGAKVKRNGETIKNFRPVQRTSDGELGMRDAISGEFYTNAGSGVFSFAPADFVEATSVQRKPMLTDEQKLALQALMDDYYNNRNTFYYEFTHNRDAFTAGSNCYTAEKGKFKQCCATFVQNIMMGRSVNDFVGKNASTYSANITKTAVSDFGYYFDFKYRKYLYGLTDTDEDGNTVYYGYIQPNKDNYEGSYSYNSYYHPDSKKPNKQNFNGFCNANDMARELYEMGCEIPFSELDIGDIIFTLDNDLSDNTSMLNFHAWRNIYHVGMVYDVKQIDASSKEIYFIECTSYFDVDNRPIEKPYLSSDQMDLRFKAFKLTEDMAFCARMPIAFGYTSNVPDRIAAATKP